MLFSWILPSIPKKAPKDGIYGKRASKLVLALSLFLSLLYGITIYLPTINPRGAYIGVDPRTLYDPYLRLIFKKRIINLEFCDGTIKRLVRMNKSGIRIIFESDRPLTLALLYLLSKQFGITNTVKAMPAICSVSFAITSYLLSRELFKENASLATLISISSFTTTIGLFGGLYANWLAWSSSLLMLTLAIRTRRNKLYIIPTVIMSIITALLHPYHWVMIQATLVIFSITSLILALCNKNKSYLKEGIGLYTATSPLLLGLTMYIMGACRGLWKHPLNIFYGYVKWYTKTIKNPLILFDENWWQITHKELYNYGMAGYYNFTLIMLALIANTMKNWKDLTDRLLTSWLTAVLIAFLAPLGAPPWGMQWRILYELPIGLLATQGLLKLQNLIQKNTEKIIAVLIVTQQINYTLRFILLLTNAIYS